MVILVLVKEIIVIAINFGICKWNELGEKETYNFNYCALWDTILSDFWSIKINRASVTTFL